MPYTYRALTANCGNDTIGKKACRRIKSLLESDNADFYIVNCQEVDYERTLFQLQNHALPKDYQVIRVGEMDTHTKLQTMFAASKTGIASFIIYNSNAVTVRFIKKKEEVRRSSSIGVDGAYNKGGLVSNITISKEVNGDDPEEIRLQLVSGHLDSHSIIKRSRDWCNLHTAISHHRVSDLDGLLKDALPHVRITGYDANTRDKLENGKSVNLWTQRPQDIELQGLQQGAIDGLRYSSSDIKTYYGKNFKEYQAYVAPKITEDPRRPGCVMFGMLDFVGISDGSDVADAIDRAEAVGYDESTARDHAVIISNKLEYTKLDDFAKVKGMMSSLLVRANPGLAAYIKALPKTPASQTLLIDMYNAFLSKKGLLNTELELYEEKLKIMEKISAFTPTFKTQMREFLFLKDVPWFKEIPANYTDKAYTDGLAVKQQETRALLQKLSQCSDESEYVAALSNKTRPVSPTPTGPYITMQARPSEVTGYSSCVVDTSITESTNPNKGTKLQFAIPAAISFEKKKLSQKQVIRTECQHAKSTTILLTSNVGSVTEDSVGERSVEEAQRDAIKQAELILTNYTAEHKAILIERGVDKLQAERVLAALLLLSQKVGLGLSPRDIKIYVPGASKPKPGDWMKWWSPQITDYVNDKLAAEVKGCVAEEAIATLLALHKPPKTLPEPSVSTPSFRK